MPKLGCIDLTTFLLPLFLIVAKFSTRRSVIFMSKNPQIKTEHYMYSVLRAKQVNEGEERDNM